MSEKVKLGIVRAHQTYKIKNGEKVPGCSTIAKIGDDPGALLHWAWTCGTNGQDYRKVRDEAATSGTLAHWLAECHIKGLEPDTSEFSKDLIDKAETAFLKFLDWWKGKTLVASELQLVSEAHRFGGTLDIVCKDAQGAVILADLKTGAGVYPSMWRQLAGLNQLVIENGVAVPAKFVIVRIGKEAEVGDFDIQERGDLSAHFQAFLAALQLYRALKVAK